mmetsp:Transcript_20656/g.41906  ORF Transcript_20656/g.41906 Transcript_20656/m.41906 type:complete len:499 (-) Transcript_20656:176-1672(-)
MGHTRSELCSMPVETSPLMGRLSSRRSQVAMALAGSCAVLAMVGLVFAMGQTRPTSLVQQAVAAPYMAVPQAGAQPMYYMPVQPAVAQQGLAAAPPASAVQQPVVYYYVPAVPAKPQLALAHPQTQMLNASGNSSSEEDSFVCSVANIKALSATVQTKWDTCKTNPNYEQPNKDAGRRLLEWVWEPAAGEARAAPSGKPNHDPSAYEMVLRRRRQGPQYRLAQMLNESGGNSSDAEEDTPSMQDCMEEAVGDACDNLAGCDDKVCASYYNEPEIEALCGMCGMANSGKFGCFAKHATVEVAGKGQVAIGSVSVEDEVMTAEGPSRVYFVHDHEGVSDTVRIQTETGAMELTPIHYLPLYSAECGDRYCAAAKLVRAETVKAGDRVYARSGMGLVAKEVIGVAKGSASVRYVLTESGTVVVDGVVASVHSTAAGALETLPFRLLDSLARGSLQAAPVAAALRSILESPMLKAVESFVNGLAPAPLPLSSRAFGAAPLSV